MHDENLHIASDPKEGFPEPTIPVDESWEKMSHMLDAEMPASSQGTSANPTPSAIKGSGFLGGSSHFWGLSLTVVGVAGAITWGILYMVNKPEKSTEDITTTILTPKVEVADSLHSVSAKSSSGVEDSIPEKTVDYRVAQTELTRDKSSINSQTQSNLIQIPDKAIQFGDHSNEPILENLDIVPEAKNNIPTPPVVENENTITEINNNNPNSANEPLKPEPVISFTGDSIRPPAGIDTVSPAQNPSPLLINPANQPGQQNNAGVPGGAKEPAKSKKTFRLSENFLWQVSFTANAGFVFQKERDANLFYGATFTGGLWNDKLKAGLETGIGWLENNDYGIINYNIRITDTIGSDSLIYITTLDTTRIDNHNYRYQYLQVPLLISKQVYAKGMVSMDIKTGPVIGFVISEKKTFDHTSGPDDGEILNTVFNDYQHQDICWQWQISPQMRWKLNESFSFTVSPSVHIYLNNLYDSAKQPQYRTFGVGVYGGLIYKFR